MPSLPLTIWHERRHSGFRRRIMTTPQRGPTEPLHSAVARWVNYTKRFRLAIIGAAAGAAAVVVSCPTAPTAAGRANAPHFGVHPSLAQARCSFRRPSRIKEVNPNNSSLIATCLLIQIFLASLRDRRGHGKCWSFIRQAKICE
jgi:hypothetical protein